MFKVVRDVLLKRGLSTAAQIGVDAATTATSKSFVQRFNVTLPTTVFVRGSHVNVQIVPQAGRVIELNASLRAFFGWEFVTEQDDAGVYIVAKRKPLVGALSTARFTLIVPPEANVVLHLTPGDVHLHDLNGKLTIPGATLTASSAPTSETSTPSP